MANKHHKPEEIVAKLRQVEVLVGQGMARMSPYGTKTTFTQPRLRSDYEWILDTRRRRSFFGRKDDGVLEGAEGRHMTQLGHTAYLRFLPEADL